MFLGLWPKDPCGEKKWDNNGGLFFRWEDGGLLAELSVFLACKNSKMSKMVVPSLPAQIERFKGEMVS